MNLNVNEYWIIDPEYKSIEVINFKDNKEIRREIITSGSLKPRLDGFEDFEIKMQDLFKRSISKNS